MLKAEGTKVDWDVRGSTALSIWKRTNIWVWILHWLLLCVLQGFTLVTMFIIVHIPAGLQVLTHLLIQQLSLSICYVLGNEESLVPFSSFQSLSHVWLFATPWTAARHVPSPTTRTCLNSCPSSWWCCPTTSSSVVPFFSCLLSFPASESFPMSQFFESSGQSIGPICIAKSHNYCLTVKWVIIIKIIFRSFTQSLCDSVLQVKINLALSRIHQF